MPFRSSSLPLPVPVVLAGSLVHGVVAEDLRGSIPAARTDVAGTPRLALLSSKAFTLDFHRQKISPVLRGASAAGSRERGGGPQPLDRNFPGVCSSRRAEVNRMETKRTVRELLDRLPDDCSLEDVLYHLYVVQAIEKGLADADAGRTLPHEEVAKALRRRWQVGAGE